MTLALRIIPRLDIKGPDLVKGVHLEGLRVLGKPEEFSKYYFKNGADELLYQDVVASLYDRNNLLDIITKTAKNIYIPLTVGGGIRTIDDISSILRVGADKVSINTAALKNPEFISKASNTYGKSTISVAIEAIRQNDGSYYAFTDNGRNRTDKEVVCWAKNAEELGAGEIILTSVDNEGTGKGLDIDLILKISKSIKIPLVVHGGTGNIEHIVSIYNKVKISGIAISSMFHFDFLEKNEFDKNSKYAGNTEFIKNYVKHKSIESMNIKSLKTKLFDSKIICRIDK